MGHIATRAMLATYSLLFTQYQSNELNFSQQICFISQNSAQCLILTCTHVRARSLLAAFLISHRVSGKFDNTFRELENDAHYTYHAKTA